MVEDKEKTFFDTVAAASDLIGPMRYLKNAYPSVEAKDQGIRINSCQGENTPAFVTEESELQMERLQEELLSFIDKRVPLPNDDDDDDDNTIPKLNKLSKPKWFGRFPHMEACYCLENLVFNLHPNRGDLFRLLVRPIATKDVEACVDKIVTYLSRTCENERHCCYENFHYKHVGKPGPVALCNSVETLTMKFPLVTSTNREHARELLFTISDILEAVFEKNDGKSVPKLCICCVVALQYKSKIDAENEVMISENENASDVLDMCTLLKVRKACEKVTTRVDYLSPTVLLRSNDSCHDISEALFQRYQIARDPVTKMWCVRFLPL